MNFSPGDYIAVYTIIGGNPVRLEGTIERIEALPLKASPPGGLVYLVVNVGHGTCRFHPKQCRRLKCTAAGKIKNE